MTKQKPKELDWKKEFSRKYYDIFAAWKKQGYVLDLENNLKDFIKQTLTQQRTELLEEIKKEICEVVHKEKHDDINGVYIHENEPNYLVDCSAQDAQCYNSGAVDQSLKIREKLINLLNKKDETK